LGPAYCTKETKENKRKQKKTKRNNTKSQFNAPTNLSTPVVVVGYLLNHNRKSLWTLVGSMSSHIFSKLLIQLVIKWQFCNSTHSPFCMPVSTIVVAGYRRSQRQISNNRSSTNTNQQFTNTNQPQPQNTDFLLTATTTTNHRQKQPTNQPTNPNQHDVPLGPCPCPNEIA
jgi:hypothetical protein